MKPITLEIWQEGRCRASVDAYRQDSIYAVRHYAKLYECNAPVQVYRYFHETNKREPFDLYPRFVGPYSGVI